MGLTGLPALAETCGAIVTGVSTSLASDVPRLNAALALSTPQRGHRRAKEPEMVGLNGPYHGRPMQIHLGSGWF